MRKLINCKLLFLCPFLLAACGNENDPTPSIPPANQPDAIELGVTAGVTLTKSAVTANTGLTGGIAVYAGLQGSATTPNVDPYTSTLKNNYAIYTGSTGAWTNASTTDKIYLTSQTATIFAHYPAYKPTASGDDKGALVTSAGTALKASETSNKISAASTVDVSVFPGKSGGINTNNYLDPSTSNAELVWNTSNNTWEDKKDANKNVIISAPGEVDYMWGSETSTAKQPVTSNGKAAGNSSHNGSVALKMNHALAMVSFRIYNDGTYKNAGMLTKIQLRNKASNADLNNGGTTPTMKISDGTITDGTSPAAVTYTRFIDTDGSGTPSGYTLVKIGSADAAGEVSSTITGTTTGGKAEAAAASTKFSIMVLPVSGKASQNVEAVFTIDGADYPVALGNSSSDLTWAKGNNYLYTAKLSGKELSITSVTVAEWGDGGNKDLVVN